MGCCSSKASGGVPLKGREENLPVKKVVEDSITELSTAEAKRAAIISPISTRTAPEDQRTFVKNALKNNAIFSAELKFSKATDEELETIVNLIASKGPLVFKKGEAAVNIEKSCENKLLIIYRGLFKGVVSATESHVFKPGQLRGDFRFLRGCLQGSSNIRAVKPAAAAEEEEGAVGAGAGVFATTGGGGGPGTMKTQYSEVVAVSDSCSVFEVTLDMLRLVIAEDRPYRDIQILQLLSPEQLEEIDVLKYLVYLKEGKVILKKGDKNFAPNLYIILSGTVEIVVSDYDQQQLQQGVKDILTGDDTTDYDGEKQQVTTTVEDEEEGEKKIEGGAGEGRAGGGGAGGVAKQRRPVVLKGVGAYIGAYSLLMQSAQPYTVKAYTDDVILARIPYLVSTSEAFVPLYNHLEMELRREGIVPVPREKESWARRTSYHALDASSTSFATNGWDWDEWMKVEREEEEARGKERSGDHDDDDDFDISCTVFCALPSFSP